MRPSFEVPAFGYISHPLSTSDAKLEFTLDDYAVHFVVTDIHQGLLPLSATLLSSSEATFHIRSIKLPEDGDGLIVRGENITDSDVWVTLTPWRAYPFVEVVTMDEVPTGGQLAPESNGAIRFKAGPHRILTFWFHD